MRTLLVLLLAACSAGGASKPTETVPPAEQALSLQDSFRRVAAAVAPAVVSVRVEHASGEQAQAAPSDPHELFRRFFGGDWPPMQEFRPPPPGLGSGFLVDGRGHVLTNDHVVAGASRVVVELGAPKPKEYAARLVGRDPVSDLAVVRIEAQGLPFAPLGDSSKVRPGDWAIAVGSPFGLEQTLTVGVVSAVREAGVEVEGRTYTGFIQTDAAINRGNSGGPLLNIRGEVIGVNTAILAPAGGFVGVGFAIPSNTAKRIANTLIEKGRVARGWLGVEVHPLDEVMARQFGVENAEGAVVARVLEGSPAERAGLRRGDVIVELDEEPVDSPAAVIRAMAGIEPGETVEVGVVRDGRRRALRATAGERPEEAAPARAAPKGGEAWGGAALSDASPELNARFGLPASARGALVTGLEPGMAADAGLRPGDLVVGVDRREVGSVSEFLAAVKKADLEAGVLFDVNRRGRRLYLTYKRPR